MPRLPLLLATLTALAACGGPATQFVVPAASLTESVAVSTRSVEVLDVSLPTYAASDEITVQGADGALTSSGSVLWADTPERAITLELSRALGTITNAQVAPEPWPFRDFADARLDVRVETLLAGPDGIFRATGQYFVASEIGRADRARRFALSTPYDVAAGPAAIAAARGIVIRDLALLIARDGL